MKILPPEVKAAVRKYRNLSKRTKPRMTEKYRKKKEKCARTIRGYFGRLLGEVALAATLAVGATGDFPEDKKPTEKPDATQVEPLDTEEKETMVDPNSFSPPTSKIPR